MTHIQVVSRRAAVRWWVPAVALLFAFGGQWMAQAQTTTATLNGTVQDASGAVVSGANVILTNAANDQDKHQVRSNGAGAFTFAGIPSGDYFLTVEATGFQNFVQQGIHLNPGDSRTVNDIRLQVGKPTETVTVSESQAGIPLDSGELSSTISASDLQRLSTVGREATELFRILPGFAIRNEDSTNTAPDFSQVEIGQATPYASNGAPVAGITLKLDGADLTDAGNFGANLQNINNDMVSEVQVQTSNFGADQPNGPVVVTGVTKAGGSAYHGEFYIYTRTSALNSNDWLSNFNGIPKPSDQYTYPGGNFGGPIPHMPKLTFFVAMEYDAQRNIYAYNSESSSIVHALVPTQAMRNGDFSAASLQQYLGPNYTNPTYANINAVPTVDKNGNPIVNGQIPAADLDPGALALLKTIPLPNSATGTDGYNYTLQNLVSNDVWEPTGRLDYAINDRNHVFLRYSYEHEAQGQPQIPYYSPTSLIGSVNTPGGGLENNIQVHSAVLNYTSILSPTFTNEAFATITYFRQDFDANNVAALQKSAIGYPYNAAYANGSTQYPQLQDYGADGLPLGLWPDYSFGAPYLRKVQPSLGDNVSKVWGTHTIKGGVFMQRIDNDQAITNGDSNGAIADYYFPPAGTAFGTYNGQTEYTSGNYLANFLQGIVQQVFQQNVLQRTNLHYWNTGFYGQDTWRIRPNFVLTYGLRIEHLGAWQDASGLGAAVWQPSTITNSSLALPGFLWHAIDPSIPDSGTGSRAFFYEPRVGFAWNIRSNTVLRGGYGAYRMHDSVVDVTSAFANSSGLRTAYEFGPGGTATLAGVSTLNLPINAGGLSTSAFGLYPGDNTEPVTNNYSVSLAQGLPDKSIVQLSYVGNNSNSLMNNGTSQAVVLNNVNALPIGALYQPHPAGVPCAAAVCTPLEVQALTAAQVQLFRPYPEYQSITVPRHNTYANYNALQAVWQKRSGHFNYGVNYTFSKALGILGSAADFNFTAPVNPFNIASNYGPMNFDRTQVFNANYSYQLGNYVQNRALGAFVNRWMISGITNVQSGPNMQTGVSFSPDFYLGGNLGSGANQLHVNNQTILGTPDVSLQPVVTCNPGANLAANQYINASCFALPAIGTNGAYILPYVHGPAYISSDLSLEKGFSVGGERNLHFRIAAFNFLNHPLHSFGTGYAQQINLSLSDVSPGATTATAVYSPSSGFGFAPYKLGRRLVELSAKYTF